MSIRAARAVVLGGGGVSGIAWTFGVLAGVARLGIDLRHADCFIGTSAGAVVGTHLAHGTDLEALLQNQLHPPQDAVEIFRAYSQANSARLNRDLFDKVGGNLTAARKRIGAYALRTETPSLSERSAIIARRLGRDDWPQKALHLAAVDTATGERRVLDRNDSIGLVDAVAASCAVPGTWPAVPVGGLRYMDGGVYSTTNADIAQDCREVIILAPFGYDDDNPIAGRLRAETETLRARGARVYVVTPDHDAADAIGDNVLDPARAPHAAQAGVRMAGKVASKLREERVIG